MQRCLLLVKTLTNEWCMDLHLHRKDHVSQSFCKGVWSVFVNMRIANLMSERFKSLSCILSMSSAMNLILRTNQDPASQIFTQSRHLLPFSIYILWYGLYICAFLMFRSHAFCMELVFCKWVFAFLLCCWLIFSYSVDLVQEGEKVREVNLDGWLVVEGWIKPSLFDGIPNGDMLDGTEVQLKSLTASSPLSTLHCPYNMNVTVTAIKAVLLLYAGMTAFFVLYFVIFWCFAFPN